MLRAIFFAFIPIFVAMDAVGVLSVFITLTRRLEKSQRRVIILESMITSLGLCFGFIFLGKLLFVWLGITGGDFMIAGGSILFILAMDGLIIHNKKRGMPVGRYAGVVPIGTPLIAGPAVLTTLLILMENYRLTAVIIAVALNIALVGFVLACSDWILYLIGESGAEVLSRIVNLFLAAMAVMMIRKGIVEIILLSRRLV
ncbi:MAG: MarC family protein [bacterium]|nr:MarC family protein [bacterium]